nr:2-C-methyl-D-erythritol 4-phosphate cytidylyltransferase [Pullulanibacillus pueri]
MKANQNKLFLDLMGKPLIAHTLKLFEEDAWCSKIILAGKPDEFQIFNEIIKKEGFCKIEALVAGGSDRQESVKKGLDSLKGDEIVLIHDGARPLVDIKLVHQLVMETEKTGAAILAVPLKDTIKKAYNKKIVETIDREALWAAQTPQGFKLSTIKAAHEKAVLSGVKGTDDASLLEALGQAVTIVHGDYRNIKVTTPEDLVVAEHFITGRET